MIEQVGYTEDGLIWMNVLIEHNGQKATLNLQMTQDQAQEAIDGLTKSIKEYNESLDSRTIQ